MLLVFVDLAGTTAFDVVFGSMGCGLEVDFGAAVTTDFAVLAAMAVVATVASIGATQSPCRDGTASIPLPIGTRLVPQFAPWARWMFWLSWSKTTLTGVS